MSNYFPHFMHNVIRWRTFIQSNHIVNTRMFAIQFYNHRLYNNALPSRTIDERGIHVVLPAERIQCDPANGVIVLREIYERIVADDGMWCCLMLRKHKNRLRFANQVICKLFSHKIRDLCTDRRNSLSTILQIYCIHAIYWPLFFRDANHVDWESTFA